MSFFPHIWSEFKPGFYMISVKPSMQTIHHRNVCASPPFMFIQVSLLCPQSEMPLRLCLAMGTFIFWTLAILEYHLSKFDLGWMYWQQGWSAKCCQTLLLCALIHRNWFSCKCFTQWSELAMCIATELCNYFLNLSINCDILKQKILHKRFPLLIYGTAGKKWCVTQDSSAHCVIHHG